MTAQERHLDPVTTEVEVSLPQNQAFEFFTAHISRWWPLETRSVSRDRAETVVFELVEGGEIFELAEGSERVTWGTVTVFEPPTRLLFTWHPGRDASTAQEVEVLFVSMSNGTRVKLEHRAWELLGEDADSIRNDYVDGWKHVLGEFAREAEEEA